MNSNQKKHHKAYTNLLCKEMMQKSSQYCASCNGYPEPHPNDCVHAYPLKFTSSDIFIANINLFSLGKDKLSELLIEPLKSSCTYFDVDKINDLFNNLNGECHKAQISMYLSNAMVIRPAPDP